MDFRPERQSGTIQNQTPAFDQTQDPTALDQTEPTGRTRASRTQSATTASQSDPTGMTQDPTTINDLTQLQTEGRTGMTKTRTHRTQMSRTGATQEPNSSAYDGTSASSRRCTLRPSQSSRLLGQTLTNLRREFCRLPPTEFEIPAALRGSSHYTDRLTSIVARLRQEQARTTEGDAARPSSISTAQGATSIPLRTITEPFPPSLFAFSLLINGTGRDTVTVRGLRSIEGEMVHEDVSTAATTSRSTRALATSNRTLRFRTATAAPSLNRVHDGRVSKNATGTTGKPTNTAKARKSTGTRASTRPSSSSAMVLRSRGDVARPSSGTIAKTTRKTTKYILLERRVISQDTNTTKWSAPKEAQAKPKILIERRVKESITVPAPRVPSTTQPAIAAGPTRLPLTESTDPEPAAYRKILKNVGSRVKDHQQYESCCCTDNVCGDGCINRVCLVECFGQCASGRTCRNRRIQQGTGARLQVRYINENIGHGLHAMDRIKKGDFIIEMKGEVMTSSQYERRRNSKAHKTAKHSYFLSLRDSKGIVYYMDAGRKGNDARFASHCCRPNSIIEQFIGDLPWNRSNFQIFQRLFQWEQMSVFSLHVVRDYSKLIQRKAHKTAKHSYFLSLRDSKGIVYYMDAGRKGNDARFASHCCWPNSIIEQWSVNGEYRLALIANTEICPGTEVTFKYSSDFF
ncbi:hypothetical protein PRIPAC_96791, partial [Pristionchus pacificus]|uniref:SET domain-containing protein n=1 Tax=Pristionchus pacificus TaxID=54126 RepID=A0A2A6BC90_PRIPA